MESNYISAPKDFQHMEGISVDLKKTFDLNGTNNDDMLRLYLRKAGLSDEIECLTPEQRRAFIYDIIKSNKMPGYWTPSTISTSSFMQKPPSVRPPPPPMRKEIYSTLTEVRNDTTPTLHYATMSTSSSSSSLQSVSRDSPLMSNRFVQPVFSPGSPTSILKSKKGMRYEISGPVNFTHVSGDMTRDMTKNAFDLSLTLNDNVLKKYLIERGIKDEEISGIQKQDLIRNIVQSRFTWMPPKQNNISGVQFAENVDEKNIAPSRTPTPTPISTPSPLHETCTPTFVTTSASTFNKAEPTGPQSNFDLITSRFPDSSLFPSPESLFNNLTEKTNLSKTASITKSIRPPPPPRRSKPNRDNVPPPPPSLVIATPKNGANIYHSKIKPEEYYESVAEGKSSQPSIKDDEDLYTSVELKTKSQNNVKMQIVQNNQSFVTFATLPSDRQAFIPNGITNQHEAPPPPQISCSSDLVSPPPPPPPPPPIMQLKISTGLESSLPPPMPQESTYDGPPPPPPMIVRPKFSVASPSSSNDSGDPRDAFLESIRKGVALKKVNQKSATISGGKIKTERKPPVTDFLSELKMGLNLRKVKISVDNPDGSNETDA